MGCFTHIDFDIYFKTKDTNQRQNYLKNDETIKGLPSFYSNGLSLYLVRREIVNVLEHSTFAIKRSDSRLKF